MNILEFVNVFPDEKSCREDFRKRREMGRISCKRCNCTKHYWLQSKWQWQCSACDFRTTLRSGTIMQSSNLPLRTWYLAMAFMTNTKKGLSACELQRQLNHKRYDTIWSLMHRIRNAMGNRDARYTLEGFIEFDEGFFETESPNGIQLKRGKGSQRQQNVAVIAESVPLENIETGTQSKYCGYFKMKVLNGDDTSTINKIVSENIGKESIVFSDKSNTYLNIENYVEMHFMEKSSNETTKSTLKWVHVAISNAKRNFLGVYHKINKKYLQLYLDEFCYKLNRRYFNDKLFDRLVIAVADKYW